MLRTLFPRRPRPRTVVHAGALLLRQQGGPNSLRRYLRIPRKREVFLIHHGQEPLQEAAEEAGVQDIVLPSAARHQADDAAEMALALGARRLDFTIDEVGVCASGGEPLRELTIREAEGLATDPGVRPRIRAKLLAGCAALRLGVARVRIGNPAALATGRATALVPDPMTPDRRSRPARTPEADASWPAPARTPEAAASWPAPERPDDRVPVPAVA